MNFRYYLPNLFSKWTIMIEFFWWGKGVYIVRRSGNGYLANYKTIIKYVPRNSKV